MIAPRDERAGRVSDRRDVPYLGDGDQGTTYYYGNVFHPPSQAPFPRDQWFCIEIHAKANTVGSSDGASPCAWCGATGGRTRSATSRTMWPCSERW